MKNSIDSISSSLLKISCVVLCILLNFPVFGQISFRNASNSLANQDVESFIPIAINDINGDHRDDIIRLDNGDRLYVDLQVNDGTLTALNSPDRIEDSIWAISVGDIDNNGTNEVIATGFNRQLNTFELDRSTYEFNTRSYPVSRSMFAQTTNFTDFNNDGFLDFFMCDDDSFNFFFVNDNGNLVETDDVMDEKNDPVYDGSGNYGSTWTDIDDDGDVDLFIAKCRQGANSTTDPRRINLFYMRDGDEYHEVGDSFNVALGLQSWAADFGDLDNDGDQDFIITNHDGPHYLYENIKNQRFELRSDFIDIGEIETGALECMLADFDLDGLLDCVIVGGGTNYILKNEGNLQFTAIEDPFGIPRIQTCATGDVNGDGKVDIVGAISGLGSGAGGGDKLYLNESNNDNHFVTIALEGQMSNRNGVGAKLELYTPQGKQSRWVNSGTSYCITNSYNQYYGLGTDPQIDSLIITWPSGMVDSWFNVTADRQYIAVEGDCIYPFQQIPNIDSYNFCGNDSLIIELAVSDLTWNDGSTDSLRLIQETGIYQVISRTDDYCPIYFNTLSFDVNDNVAITQNINQDFELCNGQSVTLYTNYDNSVWQDGTEGNQYNVSTEGSFYAVADANCGIVESNPVEVTVVEAPTANGMLIEIPTGTIIDEIIDIPNAVDQVFWYDENQEFVLESNSFNLDNLGVINADTTIYFQLVLDIDNPVFEVGESFDENEEFVGFSGDNFNGYLEIACEKDCRINSFSCFTDTPGERRFTLSDENGNILQSFIEYIEVGKNEIQVSFDLSEGNLYQLGTDEAVNFQELGTRSPRLGRIDDNADLDYPYVVNDYLSINTSTFGTGYYYYYFDINVIEKEWDFCESELIPIEISVITNTLDLGAFDLQVYPNPVNNILMVESSDLTIEEVSIYDIHGKKIRQFNQPDSKIIVQDLQSGIYMAEIITNEGSAFEKLIKL